MRSSHKAKRSKSAAVVDDIQKAMPSVAHMYVSL